MRGIVAITDIRPDVAETARRARDSFDRVDVFPYPDLIGFSVMHGGERAYLMFFPPSDPQYHDDLVDEVARFVAPDRAESIVIEYSDAQLLLRVVGVLHRVLPHGVLLIADNTTILSVDQLTALVGDGH